MPNRRDEDAAAPPPRPQEAAEKPLAPHTSKSSRDERLAKALRENLKRRKANKKD